jgi:hypothetical protein
MTYKSFFGSLEDFFVLTDTLKVKFSFQNFLFHLSRARNVLKLTVRGGLRVCPRALKNVVGCGCELDALLFI